MLKAGEGFLGEGASQAESCRSSTVRVKRGDRKGYRSAGAPCTAQGRK